MSCTITYKGQKYSEEQFKEYFINNKQEFATSIAKNKDVIDSFKRKMEGIDFVFSQSPELASIGSKAQYLQYLSTIFPDSKVKDIVYRADKRKNLTSQTTVDDFTQVYVNGVFYSTELNYAKKLNESIKGYIYPTLLNIINPGEIKSKQDIERIGRNKKEFEKINALKYKENPKDSLLFDNSIYKTKDKYGEVGKEIVVFEPEQIHILGSKQDIEGFKDYISSQQPNVEPGIFETGINQFDYQLDTYTGEVYHMHKTKGKTLETNDTQINKVYRDYAVSIQAPTVTFNKQTYTKIFDRVININNGKQVTQQQIVEKFEEPEVVKTKSNPYELFSGVFANKEQREAIDGLKDFLSDSNSKAISLIGRGGTGKTTIIKKITEDYKGSVMYIAPTHKAKNILQASVKKETRTLASSLSIDLDETTGTFKTNHKKVKMFGIPIKRASLIIIDEGSMVKDDLFNKILEEMNSGAKVIFMGDNVQLPPVGQDSDSRMFGLESFKLVERMRQGEQSPIVPITDIIAANVESNKPVRIAIKDRTNKITDDSAVIFTNNSLNFVNSFIEDYKINPSNTRMITYNNQNNNNPQSVKSLNEIIRNYLNLANSDKLVEGDQLMAYNSTIFEGGNESNPDIDIFNSNEYEVEKILPATSKDLQVTAFSRTLGPRATPVLKLTGQEVILKDKITDKSLKKIFVYDKPSLAKIEKLIKEYEKKQDYQMKIKINQVVPNLEFAYAITSHKSQGSTYNNVYVLEDNILGGNNRTNKEKNQSLYVAVSRAKTKVVIHSRNNPVSNIPKTNIIQDPFNIEPNQEEQNNCK